MEASMYQNCVCFVFRYLYKSQCHWHFSYSPYCWLILDKCIISHLYVYVMYSLFLYMLLVQFYVNHFGYERCCSNEYGMYTILTRSVPHIQYVLIFYGQFLCSIIFCLFFIFIVLFFGCKSTFIFITCSVHKCGIIQRHLLTKLALCATLRVSMFLPVRCYISFTLCDWWWWMPQVSTVQMKCRYSWW